MPCLIQYEDDSCTLELLIKDVPLTVGDYLQIGTYRDQMIEFAGGDPHKSSRETLELSAQIAKAYIVTLKGLFPEFKGPAPDFLFSSKVLSKPVMEQLFKLPPNLIRFIIKEYDEKSEPPIVNSADEAKKK